MNTDDIRWFKQNFGARINAACVGTPFTLDMITAIACQETGYIWSQLRRKGLSADQVLVLCVGDTLDDTSGRRAFPKNKDELLAHPRGPEMFDVARNALLAMAKHVKGYDGAARNPNKFCHGYGLFQYDLQFFKVDPDYFLQRRYERFEETLRKCLSELKTKLARVGLAGRASLTHEEFCRVAIAYNTGRYDEARGLKQGHKDSSGVYYGEHIARYLKLSAGAGAPIGGTVAKGTTTGGIVTGTVVTVDQAARKPAEQGGGIDWSLAIPIVVVGLSIAAVAWFVWPKKKD
jgi:hypothetical protein